MFHVDFFFLTISLISFVPIFFFLSCTPSVLKEYNSHESSNFNYFLDKYFNLTKLIQTILKFMELWYKMISLD